MTDNYILDEYDSLIEKIIATGVRMPNRTGEDALVCFGTCTKYNISERFPLASKRKLHWRSALGELLWFVSSSCNINDLNQKHNVKYWDSWRDPGFEKKHGFIDGSLGPIYSFAFRRFGGDYADGNPENYSGGVDQLANMINLIKSDPYSRRNLINLWDARQIERSKIPPCHVLFQVYISPNPKTGKESLSGVVFQRSTDCAAGLLFDIAVYSFLLHALSQICDYPVYELTHMSTNSHLYLSQVEPMREYLSRSKIDSPILKINKKSNIDDYTADDFEVLEYNYHPAIKVPIAV